MIAFARAALEESGSRAASPVRAPSDSGPRRRDSDGRAREERAERLGDGIARLGAHLDAALYR